MKLLPLQRCVDKTVFSVVHINKFPFCEHYVREGNFEFKSTFGMEGVIFEKGDYTNHRHINI